MTNLNSIVGHAVTNLDITSKRLVLYTETGAAITVSAEADDGDVIVEVAE